MAHEGRMYTQGQKSKDGTVQFWRCHFKNQCNARLHTHVGSGEVIDTVGAHAEPSDAAAVELSKRMCEVREKARSTLKRSSQLVTHLSKGLSVAAVCGS